MIRGFGRSHVSRLFSEDENQFCFVMNILGSRRKQNVFFCTDNAGGRLPEEPGKFRRRDAAVRNVTLIISPNGSDIGRLTWSKQLDIPQMGGLAGRFCTAE